MRRIPAFSSVITPSLPSHRAQKGWELTKNCISSDDLVPPGDHTKLICTATLWAYPLAAHLSNFVCARKLAHKHTSLSPRTCRSEGLETHRVGPNFAPTVRLWQGCSVRLLGQLARSLGQPCGFRLPLYDSGAESRQPAGSAEAVATPQRNRYAQFP